MSHVREHGASSQELTYRQTVTVVVPHYNAPALLERCLYGLTVQTYPKDLMDVIVTDDGSSREIQTLVRHFVVKHQFRLITQDRRGFRLATARNRAITAASGSTILCLDCDMIPSRTLVERHMQAAHGPGLIATIGIRHFIDAEDVEPSSIPFILDKLVDMPPVESASNRHHGVDQRLSLVGLFDGLACPYNYFYGCNVAFPRQSALQVGLFDESFNGHWGYEDIEFGYRLHRLGLRLALLPEAVAFHQENTVISERQRDSDGIVNRGLLYDKVPGLANYRQRVGQT